MSACIMDPKVDFVFKKIFGSENSTDILIAFLNSVFKTKGTDKEIVKVKIDNPEINKDWEGDKFSRLDIKATTGNNTKINVEIQLNNQYNMIKRTLYYWSKLYETQIKSGQKYTRLEKTVTINILNFNYLRENNRYHNTYILKEKENNEILTELQEIHFVELTKIIDDEYNKMEKIKYKIKEDPLFLWALFLKNPQSEVVKMYKEKLRELKKAAEELERLSQDEENRELYESRQKAIHDQVTNIEMAAEKGRKEGKREELIETVVVQLENKFNLKLSDELIKTIKNSDTEDLITIRNNIFDIESIDEVKKIL